MTANGWLQIALFSLAVLACVKPLGVYLVRVYDGSVTWLHPVERALYNLAGVDPNEDQHWTRYTAALLVFTIAGILLTYAVLRLQQWLPLNPQHFANVSERQAFETAASFSTNTNWQSYSGESVMSYFSQMTQLAFHMFTSAAVGIACAVAFVRGIARRSAGRLGNFWRMRDRELAKRLPCDHPHPLRHRRLRRFQFGNNPSRCQQAEAAAGSQPLLFPDRPRARACFGRTQTGSQVTEPPSSHLGTDFWPQSQRIRG